MSSAACSFAYHPRATMAAPPGKLYVGGLRSTVTDGDLDSLFRPYGRVAKIWVARMPPGFAYVVRNGAAAYQRASAATQRRPADARRLGP